jgi:hypothetical protein
MEKRLACKALFLVCVEKRKLPEWINFALRRKTHYLPIQCMTAVGKLAAMAGSWAHFWDTPNRLEY